MPLDPSPHTAGAEPAPPAGETRRTGISFSKLSASFRKLSTGDKIALVTAVIHTAILVVAAVTLLYAAKTLISAEKGVQYQNAMLIIDQSSDIADRFKNVKDERLLELLENRSADKESKNRIEEILERYQLLVFKATVLQENELMPSEFWLAFLKDFCDSMYNRYPFIQGWWAQQKVREPYASLSRRYRDLSHECPVAGQG